jgi:hypothetical protein
MLLFFLLLARFIVEQTILHIFMISAAWVFFVCFVSPWFWNSKVVPNHLTKSECACMPSSDPSGRGFKSHVNIQLGPISSLKAGHYV